MQRGPYQNAYVGYWIDEAMAGHCYMPEASWCCAGSPSRTWPCTGCRRRSSPATGPATGWPQKLGLRNEGIAVRYLEINGVWEDHVRYAITSEEWARAARAAYLRDWILPRVAVAAWLLGLGYGFADDGGRVPEERLDVALVAVAGLGVADDPAQALALDEMPDRAGGRVAVRETGAL